MGVTEGRVVKEPGPDHPITIEPSGARITVTVAGEVATDSHSRYLITYTPANQKRDGAWREISVEAPEGLRVRTRAGYLAPSPPPIRPTIEFTVRNAAREYVDVNVDDLEVLEDGVTQVVDTFQEAVNPVSIVMALDSSGSMKNAADLLRSTDRDFGRRRAGSRAS